MYDNLIKRLEEKFPEETFAVEKDETGLYTISAVGKVSVKCRPDPSKNGVDITEEADALLFDTISQMLQLMSPIYK